MLKKLLVVILLMFFSVSGVLAATTAKKKKPYITKVIEVTTQDAHIIKGKLIYPRTPKDVKVAPYPTIVFLHSLGYSSTQWGSLPDVFLKQGYAVLLVDLRGHGLSNKDAKFRVKSWTYFTNKIYKKYPSDVCALINQTKRTTKKVSFNNYSIIGGDIGANTAILVAQQLYPAPKSIVLLTPSRDMKGLNIFDYKLPNTPILVMCSRQDKISVSEEVMLKLFAKDKYIINNTDLNTNGMMILKLDSQCRNKAIQFINQNMPAKK